MSDDLDDMAKACIDAGERVMRTGSADVKAAMRIVLLILGQDIAQKSGTAGNGAGPHNPAETDDDDEP